MKSNLRVRRRRNGTAPPPPATTRVAVYCRQSVDRGDVAFGSLEAQREAVEAYVASQRSAGWEALPEHYDDGGYTGANTERPAFQRLLADIEAGKVDVVAVYRTDRLSRSLLDFAQLMELFEAHGVAFVSITEHFDTSSPMGRMVLNLLATFAQFERETIAQRTRDKIRASRRRGMWTGGRPVLGYDVVERVLVVNEDEAEQVRAIFALYLELGSLLTVIDELKRRGWTGKTWANKSGRRVVGRPFTKTALHSLLTNPLYLGKVRCGEELCDGAHEAIVDADTWRTVQERLRSNAGGKAGRRRRKHGALLAGLVRCAVCDSAMSVNHTKRGPKQYAYYVCGRQVKEGAKACPGSRVPAGDLEAAVVERIHAIARDPAVLAATLDADRLDREARKPELVAEGRRLAAEKGQLSTERENLLAAVAAGGPSSALLLARVTELDGRLGQAEQRAAEIRKELAALDLDAVDPGELQAALADLEPVWAELFPKEQARVLELLVQEVRVNVPQGRMEIDFRPGGPKAVAGGARR